MTSGSRRDTALLGALCLVFVFLATANSGGYRYGIGDQAFYEPATQLRLHPELFPHDRALLESQAKLTVVDETLAGASRLTGFDLPPLFLGLYVLSLITLAVGAARFARVLDFSQWATAVFLALLTLRHRIAKTGANTLEGYMHPRQLAFGVGVLALTTSLKNRWAWTVALWILAAVIHPTTALWFGALIAGGALFERLVRENPKTIFVILLIPALVAVALSHRLATHIPFGSSLPSSWFMDPDWMKVFADKDYIFVSQWPLYAWALNLAYLPILWLIYQRRAAIGVARSFEGRLIAGALTLFAIFAASLFLSEARLALAVQLQVSRVFWLTDFLVTAYIAWWLTSDPAVSRLAGRWTPRVALGAALALSVGRGLYTVGEAGPDRRLFRVTLPDDDWSRAMQWLKTQPSAWMVLANPDHAWLYGTTVRVAASRDVVLESVKDSSISLYGRDVAMRVAERTQALAGFSALKADEARDLGRRFGATVLVTEASHAIALPRLYTNGGFTVYDLR